jgi:hypothetical protein
MGASEVPWHIGLALSSKEAEARMGSGQRIVSILATEMAIGPALSGCFTSIDYATDAGDLGDGAAPSDAGADALADATTDVTVADGGGAAIDGGAVCTPAGAPVMHTADIVADETWASGVHVVPSSIQIKSGARLTIDACSEVRLGPGASITATASAAGLDAVGTPSSPIRFVPQQAASPWGAISVTAPAVVNLASATLSGGGTGPHGSAPFGGASLVAVGTDPARPIALRLQHVIVNGSAGLGVFVKAAQFDPASVDLTVTSAGWYPVYVGAASAGSLPSGSYSGNAIDQILLQTFDIAAYDDTAPIESDVTLRDLGVPYRVGTAPVSIKVGDGVGGDPSASLTLAAGVHMLFTPQGTGGTSRIIVEAQDNAGTYSPQGALVIQGTSASPVVLDSASDTPAAADWQGLYFANLVDSRTAITYARVLHAGGASGAVGICGSYPAAPNGVVTCAIVVLVQQPPGAFLTNSHIEAAPCGVYRGWSMTDVDFSSSNEFVSIPGCTESSVPATGNECAMCTTAP